MCIRVEFHQRKKGLSSLLARPESAVLPCDFLVDRLHALRQRTGGLDLLRAVRIGPAMKYATSLDIFNHFRILEVVRVLGLLLRVEVVERPEKLVEAMGSRQGVVGVTEVVLAGLTRLVALRFEQLGDGNVSRL